MLPESSFDLFHKYLEDLKQVSNSRALDHQSLETSTD